MKPQATRTGNQKAALARARSLSLACWQSSMTGLARLDLHPRHAKAVGLAAAVLALTTFCVQAITSQRLDAQTEADWQPVEITLPSVQKAPLAPPLSPQPEVELQEQVFRVRSGDSLSTLFNRAGYGASTVHQVAYETEHGDQLSRIFPGQSIRFYTDINDELQRIEFAASELEYYQIDKTGEGFVSSLVSRIPSVFPKVRSGTIDTSFYLAGQRAGLTDKLIMELAAIFGWDIDFVLEIRQGDSFTVVYEDRFLDGEQISHGNILAAEFINRGNIHRAVRYQDVNGRVAYYSPEGESMRKAFLRTPLDVFRISSHFNLNRRHPVLNTIRAHKGTDYAAPSGTPIKAAGDGKVVFAGVNGGFGNMVQIRHGQSYETYYAHMSRFASGVRNGSYVQQGQVIGYVGMTGLATGPHLHYEFHVNGSVRNPVTVDLPDGEPIPRGHLADFKLAAQPVLALLDNQAREQQYATYSASDASDI